ncbi:MAG: hypothetical protein JWL61_1476 [Gemmatimonadetes bacterium]|nr:hypothetical protein [Gemmatimonadota bacterium]
MRKHNNPLARRRAFVSGAIVLAIVACDSGTRTDVASPTASVALSSQVGASRDEGRRVAIADNAAPTAAPAREGTATATEDIRFANEAAGAMLIRHGEASLEVTRLDDALAAVRQSASQFGGFVANTSIRNGKEEHPSATIQLRVPSAQFDGLLATLGTVGKVETVTANVQDVGEEYVDMGARATNARRMEARLIEMLATRTGKLADVLTVEQELRRVREEIERYEARIRFLEKHASVSSLDITLHEPLALINRPRPGPIVVAIGLAWERTLGVIAWCIASLGIIVPFGVLVCLGVMLYRWMQVPRFREE